MGTDQKKRELTWENVRLLREAYPVLLQDAIANRQELPYRVFGDVFGVSALVIGSIIRNETWYDPTYTYRKNLYSELWNERADRINAAAKRACAAQGVERQPSSG